MIYPMRDRLGWFLRPQQSRIEEVVVWYLSTSTRSKTYNNNFHAAQQQPDVGSWVKQKEEKIPLAPEQIKPNQKGDQLSGGEDFWNNISMQSLDWTG